MEYISTLSRIDWCSAHVGFLDGPRFYTPVFLKNYLESNLVKGVDGIWHACQGSIDISLGVSSELKFAGPKDSCGRFQREWLSIMPRVEL